jgi:osmotically-inducible protein OsmY
MAQRLAAAVPEVAEVENRLIADNELETRVSAALAADTALSGASGRILTKCLFGMVLLDGRIVAADAAEASAVLERVVEAAAAVQGVDRVINRAHA